MLVYLKKRRKIIDISDTFTNRLGMRVNSIITNEQLKEIFESRGYSIAKNIFSIEELENILVDNYVDYNLKKKILEEFRDIIFDYQMFRREIAMENFRKDNNISAPSRQNCIYATDGLGIFYWTEVIPLHNFDRISEVFCIDVLEDETFKSNEIFIPNEGLTYEEMYKESYKYWNPKLSSNNDRTNEYLVKGKVKILKKVDEINPKYWI